MTPRVSAAAGVACGAVAFMAWAVRGRSSAVFGPSAWRGDPGRRAIALTFDDGPSEATPYLLDVLAREGVPATFFQVGANVERLPGVAREVREAGHEIGNHSHTHPYFHFKSAAFMEADLARAQQAIAGATGAEPRLMRAPYGVRWPGIGRAQRRLQLLGIMWTVIGYDWKLSAHHIARRVAGKVRNGAIVCLHDGRELTPDPPARQTVEAVSRLIPVLRDRGFDFQTVTQLLCPTNSASDF
ncbi:MAG TPA: polysaccharide deacetylase family protein [Bryobacteraceae bacterium]|nr:polysaccharide deacetylase family protein [Bryobacteraceae bacterium]